jgi:hypothetical protein
VPIPYFYGMNSFFRCLLSLLLAVVVISGCDSPGRNGSRHHGKTDPSSAADNSAALRPDIFFSAPGNVEGCVGLYTYDSLNIAFDSLDVDKGRKIFVTKATDFAFFRLHRKDIILHYIEAESRQIDKQTFKEVYRGDGYMAVLVTQMIREEGETVWSTGTLEIIQIEGNKHFKIKIRGLSGC